MAEDVTRVLVDATTVPAADPLYAAATEGSRVGRYVVGKQLGVGGMGEVYAAEDPELGRKVALKFVRLGKGHRGEGRSRLLREAQALAQLNHPNVVTIYDAGTYGDDRLVYVAMEYIEGVTLRAWLGDHPSWVDTLRVLIHAGRGLAAAHRAGIVHRDFKPQNVMLDAGPNPRVRVLDFGLALGHGSASNEEPVSQAAEVSVDSGDSLRSGPLTETGAVLGTPAFMAPEQFSRGPLDARTDQFAFCTTAYRALYEGQPYAGDNGQEIRAEHPQGATHRPAAGHESPRPRLRRARPWPRGGPRPPLAGDGGRARGAGAGVARWRSPAVVGPHRRARRGGPSRPGCGSRASAALGVTGPRRTWPACGTTRDGPSWRPHSRRRACRTPHACRRPP